MDIVACAIFDDGGQLAQADQKTASCKSHLGDGEEAVGPGGLRRYI